ncbi:hypothetical protein [Lysobacter capsici]|uniref:hypothetical protein n=1 Tax=Lysobacter capsici TaxID=435897 RepID=UPI00398D3B93
MRPTVVLLLSLAISNAFAAPARQQQTVLMQGKPAGGQTVDIAADGSTRVEYQFKDRGRGDHTKTRWSLDAAGLPIEFDAEGTTICRCRCMSVSA